MERVRGAFTLLGQLGQDGEGAEGVQDCSPAATAAPPAIVASFTSTLDRRLRRNSRLPLYSLPQQWDTFLPPKPTSSTVTSVSPCVLFRFPPLPSFCDVVKVQMLTS